MADHNHVLEIRHLSKSFGKHVVLKDIDFQVDTGDVTCIIGASGSGKSTLLRCINMLETPTTGEILYHEKDITDHGVNVPAYRSRVGMVFQSFNLFNNMTVLDNCMVGQTKKQKKGKEDARKKPAALSGGQQQRVAIARAVAAQPKLLLLDEPTSALDPEYTTEVLNVIRELKEEGMRFIIVTHEMGFARHACDKAAFLCEGSLLEYGESAQLFAHPETEQLQRFLGKLLEWNV